MGRAAAPKGKRAPANRRKAPAMTSFPIHIRAAGLQIERSDRDYLRRKLQLRLGKFGRNIERVSVRIGDTNGPRGGADKTCAIKVVLPHVPSVVVTTQAASLKAAMDGALQAIARTVRRRGRRWTSRSRTRVAPTF
jgi:ribosome-associated translation inhibitor RaiA